MATSILQKVLRLRLPDVTVILSMVCYAAIFSYLSLIKNAAYQSYAWDLGIFNQSLWTATHDGRFFFTTVEQYIVPSGSFFGTHFSPVLFLLVPIYALFPSPNTLLVIQSCVLALGALPVYLMARKELKNTQVAALLSCSYLAYPFVQGVNWFDFHVESFLPLFFGFSVYYLRKENWKRFILFVLLTLAVIEFAAVVLVFIGIYLLFVGRRDIIAFIRRRIPFTPGIGIPFILIALALSWYELQTLLKAMLFPVSPDEVSTYYASSHWSVLGVSGNPLYIPLYAVMHPAGVISAIGYDAASKGAFLLFLFIPLLFLPLRNSYTFVATSWLVPALLSNYPPYYEIGDQYPAFLIPFLFAAVVIGLRSFDQRIWHRISLKRLCTGMLILSLVVSIFIGPYSPVAHSTIKVLPLPFFSFSIPTQNNHTAYLDRMVSLVPFDASILTQSNIFVHVSNRSNAYVVPWDNSTISSVQAFVQYVNTLLNESRFVLLDVHTGYSTPNSLSLLQAVSNRSDFGVYAYADGIYLYEKSYRSSPVFYIQASSQFAHSKSSTTPRDETVTSAPIISDVPCNGAEDSAPQVYLKLPYWLVTSQIQSFSRGTAG